MEWLSTDAQRHRRHEFTHILLADQSNAVWDHVQMGAMLAWEIAERERVADLPPPTAHRSIQRADDSTTSRRMILHAQMGQRARDRQCSEVLRDRETHFSAQEAVESARRWESLRRRGELHDDGWLECDDDTPTGEGHTRARSDNSRHETFSAPMECGTCMHGARPRGDASRATSRGRSRPWRSRSPRPSKK